MILKLNIGIPILVVLSGFGFFTLPSRAQLCETAGKDGVGSPSGVIDTYYPGVINPPITAITIPAGSVGIPVGLPTGSVTPISAGDLLLVIQMQAATINFTNSSA